MTARIIGAPPEQSRSGAVFGDVERATIFDARDPSEPSSPEVIRWLWSQGGGRQLSAVTSELVQFPADWPVTLLTVTPAEPEPDPAVTTYGELADNERFYWAEGEGPNNGMSGFCRVLCSRRYTDSEGIVWPPPHGETPVRRVSPIEAAAHMLGDAPASVVVHEEPDEQEDRQTATKVLRHRRGAVMHWPRSRGGTTISLKALARLVQQGAALLSTPEPTTADPKPVTLADVNEGAEQASERVAKLPNWQRELTPGSLPEDRSLPAPGWEVRPDGPGKLLSLHSPGGGLSATVYRACGRSRLVDRSWRIHDAEQARKVATAQAKDRSKPAPGWRTRKFAINDGPWRWDLQCKDPGDWDRGGYCDCPTEEDAIAESWAFADELDAEQARKAGES